MKICTKCNQEKNDDYFSKNCYWCKECFKQYRLMNKEQLKTNRVIYLEENHSAIKNKKSEYYLNNRDYFIENQKQYNLEHQKEIKEYQKIYQKQYKKNRKTNDISYKLRSYVSVAINRAMIKFGSSKNNHSIMQFLPYSIKELKLHLERQFESWMTWDNYGKYQQNTWVDNDQSTWKWNIDHIISQASLPYTNMKEDNFKKCWALDNLRPYSAKQNLIDGNRK